MSICVPPLQPLDYTAILTLPPAPENSVGQKTAAAAAHLLTGSSGSGTGYLHKRAVASVPVNPVARPYYGKRAAQVYQGLLEEKDHFVGKRSAAVYLEFDESNADHFYGKREAPYLWGNIGKREAARYPYKRSAAESLEVDESNADHFLGKREAPGTLGKREAARYPYKREAARYPYKTSAAESADVQQEMRSFILGKREAARYPYKRSAAESADVQQEMRSFILGKREAPGYPYKREAARYPYKREFDGSNADNVYGHYYGKREAPGYPYKREAARYPYKRSAAESLEVDESNADYDYTILGKEEAPAYPYKAALTGPSASRHHIGKRSVPADVQQEKLNFAQYGKRAAPTSMEAEYDLAAEYNSYY